MRGNLTAVLISALNAGAGNAIALHVDDGSVQFDGTLTLGATTAVSGVLDDDTMAADSATDLATQQSIKAYVDTQILTTDTLAEILAIGNTSGGTNIIVSAGDSITVDTIAETTGANGVVIDSWTLKDGGAGIILGGANTFNITNGTAIFDMAIGVDLNMDADS